MDDLSFDQVYVIKIQCIELQFCQRYELPYIVVDVAGDVLESLFLYLQLGLQQLPFSIRFEHLQLEGKIHLSFAVGKKDDQDKAQQQEDHERRYNEHYKKILLRWTDHMGVVFPGCI